uniref:Uncharacterized protein n=1 Tax=Peronospora matthiolae TaxID=2874970 RepID=A0AAV1THR4_9STRA
MKQALKRSNIMIFASEVPVISALNPYRTIEDVFLNVWRRTNPRQVSALQEDLAMSVLPSQEEKMRTIVQDLGVAQAIEKLLQKASKADTIQQVAQAQAQLVQSLPTTTPLDVKSDVVQFVTSSMHKEFGVKHESAGIQAYEKKERVVVNDRNVKFAKRKVATHGTFTVSVGGKIDGRADGKVIEVKNRLRKFLSPLPKYDVAQLQTYLFILGAQEGEIVEHLHAATTQTKMTPVAWDGKMWHADIAPYLVKFGSALTYLMQDTVVQKDYLQSDSAQQREIIKYLWSREVQQTMP